MNKFAFAFIGVFASFIAFGQGGNFSLAEAQQYAVDNAYSVLNNKLEYEKSKKVLLENIAQGLPQVFANADWTQNINLQAFVTQDANGNPQRLVVGTPYLAGGTISGEQLIFDGSYIVAVMASTVLKENAENEIEKSEIDIKEQVAKAYHLVLVADKSLEIVRENMVFIEKNYKESKRMFEVGFMEETDVDQLELILANLSNQADYLEKQAKIARMMLKFNMGIDVKETISLKDDVETLMVFSQDGESILNTSFELTNHIDYRILETQERGQHLNLKNENMAFVPKLKMNYLYQHNVMSGTGSIWGGTENIDYTNVITQNFGFNLSVPIMTGGSRYARVQQAKINVAQIDIAKKQLNDNLLLQYETAKAEYSYALNSYNTQMKNQQIAKKIRDVSSRKFAEGIISSIEFTQTQNQYQDALSSVIDAANNVLDKKVQLEKIIGKYNN